MVSRVWRAALDSTTGKVIGSLHSRHRAQEFLAFLKTIDAAVPADLDCHVVLDNASMISTWNDSPRPCVWAKTADQILDSIASHCRRMNDSGH